MVACVLAAAAPAAARASDTASQADAQVVGEQADVRRISGATDYEVAAQVAGGTCESEIGSHSVALASGENWPDALAGSALDRPLLLTKQAFLPAPTRAYLAPCSEHPKAKVIVLGGTAAVSAAVEQDLRDMGYRVDRLAGADRYATARRVAATFAPDEMSRVYLASGANYADAVAAAPSVSQSTPLILTTPTTLHAEARRFLTAQGRTVASVTILGGPAAVSPAVESELDALGFTTRRVAGADRYETAALLARDALGTFGCHPVRDVAVSSGVSPYGGLAAAAVRGPCQPLLLAPKPGQPVPESVISFARDWRLSIGDVSAAAVTGIGPVSQVPDAVLTAIVTGSTAGPISTSQQGEGDTGGGAADWERLAASVVQVECRNAAGAKQGHGSGFAVGDGRQIVTNSHVVFDDRNRACSLITVRFGGTFSTAPAQSTQAVVQRSAAARDLVLLSLDTIATPLPAIEIAEVTPRAGDAVTILGYPGVGGDTMTLTTGRYSGTQRIDGQLWIKTDAQISPGNSGGASFDSLGRLVGVPTAVNPITFADNRSDIAGTLGLLVPAADVASLLDGTIGSRPERSSVGDGQWRRDFTTQSREPYLALLASADDHTLSANWNDVEPGLFIWCNDRVEIDFWWPVTRSWGRGPYIEGQVNYRNREVHGRVPVAYRIGDPRAEPEIEFWWPSDDRKRIVSGDQGASFVTALLNGSGHLAFGWTNWNGNTEAIRFPEVDGFSDAYEHLEQNCP